MSNIFIQNSFFIDLNQTISTQEITQVLRSAEFAGESVQTISLHGMHIRVQCMSAYPTLMGATFYQGGRRVNLPGEISFTDVVIASEPNNEQAPDISECVLLYTDVEFLNTKDFIDAA